MTPRIISYSLLASPPNCVVLKNRKLHASLVENMKRNLKMKCSNCGHWNRVPINKVFVEQPSPIDPNKVKVMIPMYLPLQVSKCKKCGKIIAERKELIRIRREMPIE